jgi:hypothetical protein
VLALGKEKKGQYKSGCPKLKLQEINVGVQNLNNSNCEKGHGLFSSKKNEGLVIVQDKEKEEKGVQGILSTHHLYIDMCASYASTPYCEHLGNIKVQECGLVGHSNGGLCGMETTGDMGPSSRCGSMKKGMRQSCLSKRSSRRSGLSPTTQDVTMDSLSGTQTKEISSSRTTAREYRAWTFESQRPKPRSCSFKQCRAMWKDIHKV